MCVCIYICMCVYIYIYIYIYIYAPHLLYPSFDKHLGCLHVLAVVKQCCNAHWDACTFLSYSFLWIYDQESNHFTQIRMAIIKNLQTISAGEGVEKWRNSSPPTLLGWNVNSSSHYGTQYGGSSKKKKN